MKCYNLRVVQYFPVQPASHSQVSGAVQFPGPHPPPPSLQIGTSHLVPVHWTELQRHAFPG